MRRDRPRTIPCAVLLLVLAAALGAQNVDVVGNTANAPVGTGLAKGLSYDITIPVTLFQAEFWLNFSDTQTLGFYVYTCPTEYGTYAQAWTTSAVVTGAGAAWYSSGPIGLTLVPGTHYIIAVSWSGTLTYYYSIGDSQATSFGSETNAYATGTHPLGPTISSLGNDIAIYYQRLTTIPNVPPVWQTNGTAASLDIDGVQVANPYGGTPATVATTVFTPSTLNLSSTLAGTPYDVLVGFMPPVPAGGGGIATPGGQFVNLDLTDPLLTFLFGSGLTPGLPPFPGPYSVPLFPDATFDLAIQAVFLNPAQPDGFSLSQAVRYMVGP